MCIYLRVSIQNTKNGKKYGTFNINRLFIEFRSTSIVWWIKLHYALANKNERLGSRTSY